MAKALSVDLRRRVVDAVEAGASCRSAAARFGVGVSSAIRWVKRARDRGDLSPDKRGGNHRSHRIDAHTAFLIDLNTAEPDLTLVEIAEQPLAIQSDLFLAASRFALYRLGGEFDTHLRAQAAAGVAKCRQLDSTLSPDPRMFPPSFRQLFAQNR